MINDVLKCIEEDINDYFRVKLPHAMNGEKKVVIANIVNQDGSSGIKDSDKIILSLYNIEKDAVLNNGSSLNSGINISSSNSLNLNIYILFTAHFFGNNYMEGLKFISFIIGYFQKNNHYTRANPKLASINANIEKLIFEMVTLNPEQANSMWGAIGAKMMPFAMYKVRTLSFDESIIKDYRPQISNTTDSM